MAENQDMNLTANDAQQLVIPLERDLDAMGWDQGFNAWFMHQSHEGNGVELIKIIDRCMEVGPMEMIEAAPPPMNPCNHGIVVQFDCWLDEEKTRSIRYVIAGLRSGVTVAVTREQDAKPVCRIIPNDTMPNAHPEIVDIILALRAKVTQNVNDSLPDILQQLFGGNVVFMPVDPRMFQGEPPDDNSD